MGTEFVFVAVFSVGIELRTSNLLSMFSTTELHLQPQKWDLNKIRLNCKTSEHKQWGLFSLDQLRSRSWGNGEGEVKAPTPLPAQAH